jgi:ABC-type phosphate transport system substrate-binding protein
MHLRTVFLGFSVLSFVLLSFVLLSFAAEAPAAEQTTDAFRVVVNVDNPTESMTRSQVSKLFMKSIRSWPDGNPVRPVDQRPESSVRENFSKRVHRRSVAAVRTTWQRRIFSGKDVPPPSRGSEDEILVFVAMNPGAVGYVSSHAALDDGLKVLNVVD